MCARGRVSEAPSLLRRPARPPAPRLRPRLRRWRRTCHTAEIRKALRPTRSTPSAGSCAATRRGSARDPHCSQALLSSHMTAPRTTCTATSTLRPAPPSAPLSYAMATLYSHVCVELPYFKLELKAHSHTHPHPHPHPHRLCTRPGRRECSRRQHCSRSRTFRTFHRLRPRRLYHSARCSRSTRPPGSRAQTLSDSIRTLPLHRPSGSRRAPARNPCYGNRKRITQLGPARWRRPGV